MVVPSLDGGEAGFNMGDDPVLDCFRLQLPLLPGTTQTILLHSPLERMSNSLQPLLPLTDHLRQRLPPTRTRAWGDLITSS